MSSSSDENNSHPEPETNGDFEVDDELQEPDDPEAYDSDLDLTKDVQPISSYLDDREELFRQVLCTLEPEGRLDALIPEILTVLPRLELEQLCLDHLKTMSSKKLRGVMEGLEIADISDDDEEIMADSAPKWKPLQDESNNALDNENDATRSNSRTSSISGSSRSGSRRRKRHHRIRRGHRRRHRHSRHRKHRQSRDRRHHRRHRHRSLTESSEDHRSQDEDSNRDISEKHEDNDSSSHHSENEVSDRLSNDGASSKSGSASLQSKAAIPMFFDPSSNMMIPVIPPTASTGFVDPAFPVAAVPVLPPKLKSQYDVSVEDELMGDYDEDVYNNDGGRLSAKKSNGVKNLITSRLNVPQLGDDEMKIKKSNGDIRPVMSMETNGDVTPPPPGTDDLSFENTVNPFDEPAPPGTAEITF